MFGYQTGPESNRDAILPRPRRVRCTPLFMTTAGTARAPSCELKYPADLLGLSCESKVRDCAVSMLRAEAQQRIAQYVVVSDLRV